MHRAVLVAFDFDHTICDDNTDIVVRKLLPEEKLPDDVKGLYRSSGWIAYMSRIFELLHDNSIDAGQIEKAVVGIPAVAGIEALLTVLRANGHEVIIISDSNTVFIESWLKSRKLEGTVKKIFTNPAWFDDDGTMRVDTYHTQRGCNLSTVNLCKGQILLDYIKERSEQGKLFERIVYIGDGKNDLCPVMRLSANDLACPRKDYALMTMLSGGGGGGGATIKAKILPWRDGADLLRELQEVIGSTEKTSR